MTVRDERLANMVAALAQELDSRVRERSTTAVGLSAAAPAALVALHEYLDGSTLRRVHDSLGLTHLGAVRLVDRLTEAGFVERRAGADARTVTVWLTASGRRTARRIAHERALAIGELLHVLSAAQRDALTPLVESLIAAAVDDRLARRATHDEHPPWFCRMCDFGACGRPVGTCPAANAATRPPPSATGDR